MVVRVGAAPLEVWFEFASTYSHPAVARVRQAAARAGVPLAWKPFLLGPIFQAQGWNDSPFNLYPAKGRYMWRDVERMCAKHGVPFRRPTRFPRSGLLAARVACLVADEPWAPDFVAAVYRANFVDDREIAEPAVVTAILDALGRPGEALVVRAGAPATKALLRRQTEDAAARGIFGAPTFVVDRELFWGGDRLEDALAWAASAHAPTGG
jgi:2-hydroxychromene-2-carboxylate isomerase